MNTQRSIKILNGIFNALSSLKLAVLVILGLAISLATATVLESPYDTPTAQYWIYKSAFFYGLLISLGVNIFCVAMSRYPWKLRHLPFLLAHLGILILLGGSWITQKVGIDGNLRISEGESASIVELDSSNFVIGDTDQVYSIPIPWIPPGVRFNPLSTSQYRVPYDLKVDQFLSHADSDISFVKNPAVEHGLGERSNPQAAVRLIIEGGPMRIKQDYWLWEGSSNWKIVQAGPARLSIGTELDPTLGHPQLGLKAGKDGSLSYLAQASDGKQVRGVLPKGKIIGQVIHPGWKGNVTVSIVDWIPDASVLINYKSARVQYGTQAPPSAIHVSASEKVGVWLGLGDRAEIHIGDRNVTIGYFPKRVMLPFSVRLDRFTVEHDQGTMTPAAYSSRVSVLDNELSKEVLISMNEPLQYKGFTLYQASYEDGDPRPVTSILSVNRDPGRIWKYLGSLLIVLGSVMLFAVKYRRAKISKAASESNVHLQTSLVQTKPSEA